ncbi:dsba-like thioredoxin domain-containing protein [Ophiostoma piceae UAMH 11346]|uniref:Glutathione S-transferase kappa n=1 Tax=Ophiostoma piceae (strain UAMH 11346) TaxID=1262450 RepID=S3CYX6_OPHP1|nr:dsba-like thioredoxin domain-containing protein [Ophiostoma piceae UAMH 11346]
MGGRIDVYLDVASLYSYLALIYLRNDSAVYAANGVELAYHPVLLGAINQATGNKPPFMLPAKAVYGMHDIRRSCERAGVPEAKAPRDFFKKAMTVFPLRALHYIKSNYDSATFVAALHYLFYRFWTPPNADLREPAVLRSVLSEARKGFNGDPAAVASAQPLFAAKDVDAIVAAATEQAAKDQLTTATKEAIARGAFGAPWFWVRNDAGAEEPFFGSDRFHFIYKLLGLPYHDVALLDSSNGTDAKL